jgi:hypothetical protein
MPLKLHRLLIKVTWVQGDATEMKTVENALKNSDAAVHAIGMFLSQYGNPNHHDKIIIASFFRIIF